MIGYTVFVHDHADKKSTKCEEETWPKQKSLVDRSSQIHAEHESRQILNGKKNKQSIDIIQSNNKKGRFLG